MNQILSGVLITGAIALFLGVVIAILSKVLEVKKDKRIEELVALLPGFNCGACGNPGCAGMAEEITEKNDPSQAKKCKPGKEDMRQKVAEYMETHKEAIYDE